MLKQEHLDDEGMRALLDSRLDVTDEAAATQHIAAGVIVKGDVVKNNRRSGLRYRFGLRRIGNGRADVLVYLFAAGRRPQITAATGTGKQVGDKKVAPRQIAISHCRVRERSFDE